MNEFSEIFTGVLGIVLFLLLVLLTILWLILPFAVFGIKDRLDKLITNIQGMNQTQSHMLYELQKSNQILKAVHNVQEDES